MKSNINKRIWFCALASLILTPVCVGQDHVSQPTGGQAPPEARVRQVVYVKDFDLDANRFKQDLGGITGKGYLLPAPPRPLLRRKRQAAALESSHLTTLMSDQIVADLRKAGFDARRLERFEPRPTQGLIVSGVITELSEGNQMRRALLGFGSGNAKMELYVTLTDISGTEKRFYDVSANKTSMKGPGAVLTLNPYLGAAKFVAKFAMTKNAPEKMVKKTASKIATELAKSLNAGPGPVTEALNIR
jgi:hypothetical protein